MVFDSDSLDSLVTEGVPLDEEPSDSEEDWADGETVEDDEEEVWSFDPASQGIPMDSSLMNDIDVVAEEEPPNDEALLIKEALEEDSIAAIDMMRVEESP